ncbi:hypothetical protein EIP91_007487 [Steccherinum ochraceum]|uniref:Cytochrome P450 n=1 Tax=Steccherinum ochraceum TaxID=92696 RepID=A0A4V2MVE1_9APHY|nr:hypothetical protein EIP91_007487 [Steccherinum ochraceum]
MGLTIVTFIFAGLSLAVVFFWKPVLRRYPPGPPPKPLIGNALDMPTVRAWEKYRDWCQQYNSDIIYLELPTHPVIVLGSVEVAEELLEKRSHTYSGRPCIYMLELMTWDLHFGSLTYGSRWRTHRQLFHKFFPSSDADKYQDVQLQEARRFLTLAMKSPQHTRKYARQVVTAIIVKILYGKQITGMDDKTSGRTLPVLAAHPKLASRRRLRRLAEKYIPYVRDLHDTAYDEVKVTFIDGTPPPCVVSSMIDQHGDSPQAAIQKEIAKNVAGSTYTAGADTTTSSAQSFLLAMALFPEVQRKAQAELDRVVGSERLPTWHDMKDLTCVRAVMETLRWMPIAPFGVPHSVTADDVYESYFIPKGVSVIPNEWAMLHNPVDYPDPEVFNPDRFVGQDGSIDSNVRDPSTIIFGFGRRICPGSHLAVKTLEIFIASVLHVFNISAGVDANGEPLQLSTDMEGAMVAAPCDVPTGLEPRSTQAVRLVQQLELAL